MGCPKNGSHCYCNYCYFQNPFLDSLQADRESSNLVAHHSRPCLPFQSHHLLTWLQDYLPLGSAPWGWGLTISSMVAPGTGPANSRWLTKALLLWTSTSDTCSSLWGKAMPSDAKEPSGWLWSPQASHFISRSALIELQLTPQAVDEQIMTIHPACNDSLCGATFIC